VLCNSLVTTLQKEELKGMIKLLNTKSEKSTAVYIETGKKKSTVRVNSAVVIPALNPMLNLVGFVREILERGVPQVIVVNDGSDSSYNDIFREIEQQKHCIVLKHKMNCGKGRALKTAFSYFIEHYAYLDGVVTADADGQHAVGDICKICERLSMGQDSLILGVRNFKENNVPKRSYMGNLVTSRIFKLLYDSNLNDTQTGLRGIPSGELAWMVDMNGERYDYELNMLIKARQRNLSFKTIPIKTLYFHNNSGSHYSTVRDSVPVFLRLISGLIQYSGTTIVSGFLDILSFFLLNSVVFADLHAPMRILISTAIARVMSSICNYSMNRRLIFTDNGKLMSSAVRYYILCICLMMTSYGLVYAVSLVLRVNESIIKLMIDFVLGFASYQIQLRWVFQSRQHADVSFPPGVINRFK
jgi:glycosyltransferase involved in cell wall biosynthesis